jgi:rod shape-determining protein MreD
MNLVYLLVLCTAALLIQSSILPVILPHWLAAGVNLALIALVHISVTRGKIQGMLAGLVLGYFSDALSGQVIGVSGISFIVAGFVGGSLSDRLFVGSFFPRAGCILLTVASAMVARAIVVEMFGLPTMNLFSGLLLWSVTGNTIFSLILYQLLLRVELAIGIRSAEEISLGR